MSNQTEEQESKMNVYEAIMKAATHIESHPKEFMFSSANTPSGPGCGTPGCAMGWIGSFAGVSGSFMAVADIMGLPEEAQASGVMPTDVSQSYTFYNRMDDLAGGWKPRNWRFSPEECARVLRLYAAKYHAPVRRTDSELVADLMRKISTERIPEDVPA